jgi:hypothetical protein
MVLTHKKRWKERVNRMKWWKMDWNYRSPRRKVRGITEDTEWGTGIAQWYSTGLRAGWSVVPVPAEDRNFYLHHRVQTGSGTHPTFYPMVLGAVSVWGNAAGTWRRPITSISCRGQECVELYLHSPNTPPWRGAQLKHRDSFTFTLSL